jgi:AAA domain
MSAESARAALGGAPEQPDVPTDLSLGEDWYDDARSKNYVAPEPISEDDYFALPDEEKWDVPRDARGLPFGYWTWSKEAWNRYGQENPHTPDARRPRPPLEVNSEAFARNGAKHRDQKPPSRVIGAATFMRSYVPISYTIGGILPSGYLYGLTAKQGSGKTALMIAAALAVAFGREDILGCPVERGRVAYVTIENPVDFKMKLAVNCFVQNISYDEIEPRVAIIDGRDTPEQIFEGLKLDARENGPFQLVCFDTFQAGFAAAGAGAFNDNEAVLNYVIRLRPLTMLPGSPSALVAFHPTKNAGESELIPYGGGSTYNEIDGNLTLWKEAQIKLYHNRLRGPEFEPKYFRIEMLSCPDIVDKQGRQILLPVMRPIAETDAAEHEKNEGNLDLALLRAMAANPDGTQLEWALAIGIRSKGTINKKLQKLKTMKLVEERLGGKWRLTPKGQNEAAQ